MTRNLSTLFATPIAAAVVAGMLMSYEGKDERQYGAMPIAASAMTASDPSLPDASTVFAGREFGTEEMAPTF